MSFEITRNMLLALSPLVVLQLSLAIFCLVKLSREGSANLNKTIWILIILFLNLLGPILFLTVGRIKDHD